MRTDDALDGTTRNGQHALEMRRVVATRVDDYRSLGSDDVGIGAGPGERSRVRRNDAPHRRCQLLDGTGDWKCPGIDIDHARDSTREPRRLCS